MATVLLFLNFCEQNHYVQTIRGQNGFHVEIREPDINSEDGFQHYKAGKITTSNVPMDLVKDDELVVSGYTHELLELQDVIQIFSGFRDGKLRSDTFSWRSL
jgi:hypothetical protein